ncbi:MAG: hypothetical protein ACRCYY_00040 [Trueperaceae bacterium]
MRANDLKRIGPALIAVGVVLLILNSNLLGSLPALLWLALLTAVAVSLWIVGSLPHWVRIVGVVAVYVFALATTGNLAGVTALAFPAMGFGFVYLLRPKRNWWAIMPGGILASIALLVLCEKVFPNWGGEVVMFLGFAATFTVLYLLPKSRGGQRWALYPAIAWIVITVLANDPSGSSGFFLPLLLIGSGVIILLWWRRTQKKSAKAENEGGG